MEMVGKLQPKSLKIFMKSIMFLNSWRFFFNFGVLFKYFEE